MVLIQLYSQILVSLIAASLSYEMIDQQTPDLLIGLLEKPILYKCF